MSNPPAGYYDDPTRPGTHRWWDGSAWAPLDAPGATFSTLTAVVERPSVTIPAGYYEHPLHPGSVTWWDGQAWADVAVVPDSDDIEIVDRELVDSPRGGREVAGSDLVEGRNAGSPRTGDPGRDELMTAVAPAARAAVVVATTSGTSSAAAPPPGVYADPDDIDHLRWWDGRAWERATAHVESPVLTVDAGPGADARLSGRAPLAHVPRTVTDGTRTTRRERERRRARRVLLVVGTLLAVSVGVAWWFARG